MVMGLGRLWLWRLLVVVLGGVLWIGGAGRVAANVTLTQEMMALDGIAKYMTFWQSEQVPQPRSWEECEALFEREGADRLNHVLRNPVPQTGYPIIDRYTFPPVPLQMGPGLVDAARDQIIVLVRNVPLAYRAKPSRAPRLHRWLIVRQRGEDNEMRYWRTSLEESRFQRLLSKQGVSLPPPAGAPAYEYEFGEPPWLHRWWPLACWPVVLGMLVWMCVARHRERVLLAPVVAGVISILALLLLAGQLALPPGCDPWVRGLLLALSVLLALLVVRHSESSKSFGVFLVCLGLPLLTLLSWQWAR